MSRKKARWVNRYGLHLRVGSKAWRWAHRTFAHKPIESAGSVPQPQPHHSLTLAEGIVAYCHQSLAFAGRMVYTENLTLRQELFHRAPGNFLAAHADCSQYGSAILHWLGVAKAASTDATGAMLAKYHHVTTPAAGRGVVWGPVSKGGVHFAFITGKTPDGKDWYVVGFGNPHAPDRNTLSGMNTYFKERGEPGHTILDFEAA